jgi:hypothetical protein
MSAGWDPPPQSLFPRLNQAVPPPPQRRGPGPVLVAGVVVALLAAAGLGWVLLRPQQSQPGVAATADRDVSPAATPESAPAAPGPDAPASPDAAPSPAPPPVAAIEAPPPPMDWGVPPQVPDWQVVVMPQQGLAYDVPPGWRVYDPTALVGFEIEDPTSPFGSRPRVSASGAANAGDRGPRCGDPANLGYTLGAPADFHRAVSYSGTGAVGELVPTDVLAGDLAREWASAAFESAAGSPAVTVAPAQPFAANGLSGHVARADATTAPGADDPCVAAGGQVRVAAVVAPAGDDVLTLVLYSDTAGEQASEDATLDAILASLRPAAMMMGGGD